MLSKKIHSIILKSTAVTAAIFAMSACSLVTQDGISECPAQLSVTFTYDRNIKFADAFSNEVKSVNVWAFNQSGTLVWSGAAAGDALKEKGFKLDTDLPAGTYDFVSWCGLEDNADFNLDTYTPISKEELEVRLATDAKDGANISASDLPGLYHGIKSSFTYKIDPFRPTFETVNISLTKDTKDIRVLLQHLDGSPIENRDFEVTITDANSLLAYDNEVIDGCPLVTYRPWNVKYGQVEAPESATESRAMTTVASLLYELSTNRLMVDADAVLTVHRNTDGQDIIRIPLIDYLLLVKGHYGDMTDQDYLDRQDDYSIVFFIDKSSNWYMANGIYINGWAVVPPQNQPL